MTRVVIGITIQCFPLITWTVVTRLIITLKISTLLLAPCHILYILTLAYYGPHLHFLSKQQSTDTHHSKMSTLSLS